MLDTNMSLGSRDGKGSGDHDTPHLWGNPLACLTTWQQMHVLIMRGEANDVRAGARGLPGNGDLEGTWN